MLDQATRLDGRAAVLDAAGDTPYVRMTTAGLTVTGYRTDQSVAWLAEGPWGPVACAVGDAGQAARLFIGLAGQGRLGGLQWLHLPRSPGAVLAPLRFTHQDDWDFLWTATPPPGVPGEERVVTLDDRHTAEITAVLDEAHPGTTTRPGDPRVGRWYGIFDDDRLVACGADRSRSADHSGDADRSRGEVGFLAGLTVVTGYQGRGLGAALTAGMTRRLFTAYDVVSLGVMWDNAPAIRLYRRLGFAAGMARTSVKIA